MSKTVTIIQVNILKNLKLTILYYSRHIYFKNVAGSSLTKRVKYSNDVKENYKVGIVRKCNRGRGRYDTRIEIIRLTIKHPKIVYPLSE